MSIKKKKLTQQIVLMTNQQIKLAYSLSFMLEQYFCGYTNKKQIQNVAHLCQKKIYVNTLNDLVPYLTWFNQMLTAMNKLSDNYQAQYNDFNYKSLISNAIRNTHPESLSIPQRIHQQLNQNSLKIINLISNNRKVLQL